MIKYKTHNGKRYKYVLETQPMDCSSGSGVHRTSKPGTSVSFTVTPAPTLKERWWAEYFRFIAANVAETV